MLEKVSGVNIISKQKRSDLTAFKSNHVSEPKQTEITLQSVPDYNVRMPISYTKTGELNLPNNLAAHCYKLANGQRVVIVPKEGPTVLKTYVGTGSMNEPDNVRGISHYIEHNLFNGSEGISANEFFKTVNKMGAYTNASTDFSKTDYVIKSNLLNENDLETQIKIHASMLETPSFTLNMLEKEKGVVNSEINMYEGEPSVEIANATIKTLYGIKSTSKDLIAGSTDNITKLTREDVIDYFNNNYFPSNMVTVITGDVKPDNAINLIAKYFSGKNKNTHERKFQEFNPINKTVRQDLYSDKTKSTMIELGFNGPQNNDAKSKMCYSILMNILARNQNSKLNEALKPYNASAGFAMEKVGCRPQDPSVLICDIDTNEKNCEQVLQEVFNQIHSAIYDDNYDLEAIKKIYLNSTNMLYEDSACINQMIGENLLNGTLDSVANYENILKSITKDDIKNFAKQYLDLNKTVVTVLHPKDTNVSNKTVSFTGTKRAINPEKVNRYRAVNNFEILTNESATNNSELSLSFPIKEVKDLNPAVPPILNLIYKEGSAFRDGKTLNQDMDKDGIIYAVNASVHGLSASVTCASENLSTGLSSILEVLYNPNITEENLEYAKSKIRENLMKKRKNPADKLYAELFKGHSSGITKDELLKALDKVTIDDIKKYHNIILQNSQGIATVSAPFAKDSNIKHDILNKLSGLPQVKPHNPILESVYEPVTKIKVLTDTDTKEQAEICEAFKFKTNRNIKDEVTIDLMNMILGGGSNSRLFNDLREKQQLAYAVGSTVKYNGDAGVLRFEIGTTTDNSSMGDMKNLQKAIDGFNKHIHKMITEKVTDEELNNAKLEFKNFVLSNTESTFGKHSALEIGIETAYGPLYNNQIMEMIDEITADDIYNAANYIFKGKPIYSIVATENTIKANETYLKNLEKE